jgi:UDP-3-O-[3-hydroxymyristoyl] glucosamine N-acyltransferase
MKGRASAVLVTPELAAAVSHPTKALIAVAQPRHSFIRVLQMFAPERKYEPGVHATAHVGERVRQGQGVHIGANAIVEDDVILEDGVTIHSGVSVGAGCAIGAGTVIYPNAVLYPGSKTGRACILHSGCVIGADGFGYVQIGYRHVKVPHLGTVEIGDEVEVGANSCIDRAKTGVTRIGAGTKIDNLVHIAHNVTVGQACLIIAQVGIAGSSTIGNGVVLAGQAGIKDHTTLGDGVRVGGQGGVIGDIAAGVTVSGYPARPHGEKMREYAAMAALPEALKRLRAQERRLSALEAALSNRAPE